LSVTAFSCKIFITCVESCDKQATKWKLARNVDYSPLNVQVQDHFSNDGISVYWITQGVLDKSEELFGTNPKYQKTNELRGLQSASELYRLSDSHFLTKFSANFCGYRAVAPTYQTKKKTKKKTNSVALSPRANYTD
jgi:hypothetical protein